MLLLRALMLLRFIDIAARADYFAADVMAQVIFAPLMMMPMRAFAMR